MIDRDALALLDIEGSERFVLSGAHEDLLEAADMPWEQVATALTDARFFARVVAQGRPLPYRDLAPLQRSWRLQQGLVDGDDLSRLLWMVSLFWREIEVDLQRVGVDLGAMWRARQWRRLLNHLDHLPRASWAQQAMSQHPEHAEKVADALARRKLKADPDATPSTPLNEYSPEVAAMVSVVDAVNALRYTFMQANTSPGKSVPVIPPHPRPQTLVDALVAKKERMARWAAHESLADRLLSRRKAETPPVG